MNVTLPSDANAHLKAGTVHGSINNDLGLPVREGRYVGRDLEGQLGTGGARVNLSNVNGTITIRRAADNKPRSEVRNLLSETREAEEFDFDDDKDKDKRQGQGQRPARPRTTDRARSACARSARRTQRREQRHAPQHAPRRRRCARARGRASASRARWSAKSQREMSRSFGDGANPDATRQIVRDSATLATKGVPRVRVATFDGPVTVHAWDKPEVRATIVKRAYDDKEMKGIKVSSVVSNDAGPNSEVNIRAEFDKSVAQGALEHDGRIVSWNSGASVELDVYVPRNSMLFVTSGDGRLAVEGVRGEMELHTGDGAIDVTGAAGRLRADTGDGRILIEGFDGEADAQNRRRAHHARRQLPPALGAHRRRHHLARAARRRQRRHRDGRLGGLERRRGRGRGRERGAARAPLARRQRRAGLHAPHGRRARDSPASLTRGGARAS